LLEIRIFKQLIEPKSAKIDTYWIGGERVGPHRFIEVPEGAEFELSATIFVKVRADGELFDRFSQIAQNVVVNRHGRVQIGTVTNGGIGEVRAVERNLEVGKKLD